MAPGDRVVYLERPDWGVGTVERPVPGGLLFVTFPEGMDDTFHPQELETVKVKAAA